MLREIEQIFNYDKSSDNASGSSDERLEVETTLNLQQKAERSKGLLKKKFGKREIQSFDNGERRKARAERQEDYMSGQSD